MNLSFVVQHMAHFYSIEPLLKKIMAETTHFEVTVLVPTSRWNLKYRRVSLKTYRLISALGYPVSKLPPKKAHKGFDVELSPFPFSKNLSDQTLRIRYSYGLAKEKWIFSRERLAHYQYAFSNGPLEDAKIMRFTRPVQVGNFRAKTTSEFSKNRILITTSHETGNFLLLSLGAMSQLQIAEFDLKLHPMFFTKNSFSKEILTTAEVNWIDANSDIYEALSTAKLLITEVSGAIFDAIAMDCSVLLYMPENEEPSDSILQFAIDTALVRVFRSRDELVELLQIMDVISSDRESTKEAKSQIFSAIGEAAVDSAYQFLIKERLEADRK